MQSPVNNYTWFDEATLQQLSALEEKLDSEPNSAAAHLSVATLLVQHTRKLLSSNEKYQLSYEVRGIHDIIGVMRVNLMRFMKSNLFVACARYQSAHELEPENPRLLIDWGDTLVTIATTFDLPLFDQAIEKYEQALTLVNDTNTAKILRRYGAALSLKAEYCSMHDVFDSSISISDIDNLADEKLGKALALKPNSAATLIKWAEVLSARLLNRNHTPNEAVELLGEIGAKFHQALTINSNKLWCLRSWGQCIDFVISRFLQNNNISFSDIQPHLESYFDVFRNLADKGVTVPLKPIIAIALVDNEQVQSLALKLMEDLAKCSRSTEVKEEALKNAESLAEMLRIRRQMFEENKKKALEILQVLPPKTLKEFQKSNLTIDEVASHYDVFMNCLFFLVDRDTAKYPLFKQQREQGKAQKQTNRKKYTSSDFERLVKLEDPTKIYKHRTYIGSGGFAEVYIGEMGKSKVAIKVINGSPDSDNVLRSLAEVEAMKRCFHKNIVKFIDCYYWAEKLWIVMEYCDGGTLHDLYQEVYLTEPEISYILRQICEGLNYLHEQGLAHLDIKSENILLNLNGHVKIADFGLVREASSTKATLTGMSGTSYWMAPEVIARKAYNNKADIWALGCVCIELAQGSPPHHELGPLGAMFTVATRGPILNLNQQPNTPKWSMQMMDFLRLTLCMDPEQRPTAAQLLEHPFLQRATLPSKELSKKLELVFLGASLRMNGLL